MFANSVTVHVSSLTEIPTEKVYPEPGEEGQEGEGHTPTQLTQQIPLPMGQPMMGQVPGKVISPLENTSMIRENFQEYS